MVEFPGITVGGEFSGTAGESSGELRFLIFFCLVCHLPAGDCYGIVLIEWCGGYLGFKYGFFDSIVN